MHDLRSRIIDVLSFYCVFKRPLTLIEIYRLLGNKEFFSLSDVDREIRILEKKKCLYACEGFYTIQKETASLSRRVQDLCVDEKFQILSRWQWLFSLIPYADVVCVAGSLALSHVHEDSDFDVIIGCTKGHIFTVRFFAIMVFGLLRIRRKKIDHTAHARNKICLNHFVTHDRYCLAPPYHIQWIQLYRNLVPYTGTYSAVQNFFHANVGWVSAYPWHGDARYRKRAYRRIQLFFELLLSGKRGNYFEKIVREIQLRRIAHTLLESPPSTHARIVYDDTELEFHPDCTKIEKILVKYKEILAFEMKKYYTVMSS